MWAVLTSAFFDRWIQPDHTVLDLGAGYGEFINNVTCREKLAMDLNPDSATHLSAGVRFLHQDCSTPWPVPEQSVDVVFTSNFLEHLPSKSALRQTLGQAFRALKRGGLLICLGPNAHYLGGAYWDFFDHHVPLTHLSLAEALELEGFRVRTNIPRFLPYTMVGGRRYPLAFLRIYLGLPPVWRLFGRQFLIVADRRS